MSGRYWLLLEKSDETRISKGIDGYLDRTGEAYHYDSLVPNHKQLSRGDYVILRKENDILGVGRVDSIAEHSDKKSHRRCPGCRSTDIRERTTKIPRWKCGKCAEVFETPEETVVDVQAFAASIVEFTRLNSPPTVNQVKSCVPDGNGIASQLSIMELDPERLRTLFEGTSPFPSSRSSKSEHIGQGFGLSQLERKAVELRAMEVVRQIYENDGWEVVDTSSSHPFDLLATRDGEIRHIEVKGTTGLGASILLTHGEVEHAKRNRSVAALVVVSKIALSGEGESFAGSGGEISTHLDPWHIKNSCLEATNYRYALKTPTLLSNSNLPS